MAAELLLDTGAFVALVDRDEKLHDDSVAALEKWTGPVVTTEAVLTETLYLVGPSWRASLIIGWVVVNLTGLAPLYKLEFKYFGQSSQAIHGKKHQSPIRKRSV